LNIELFSLSPSWENILRGALIGLVFGYGYGYMRQAKPLEIQPRIAKTKWVWVAMIGLLVIAIPVVIRLSSPPLFTPYRWDFDHNAESWGDYHDISIPQSFDGYLTFKSTGGDPSFESPTPLEILASETPVITIRMRVKPGQDTDGQIFFVTSRDNNWDGTKSVVFTTIQDGTFQTYNILMSESSAWQGVITKLRLDPCGYGNSVAAINCGAGNAKIEIDYISVHAP